MKPIREQAYLSLLSKRLNKLLDILQKKKPGSGYSDAEIKAFSSFPTKDDVRELLDCVQTQQRDNWLVRSALKAPYKSAVYYFQLKLATISRLMKILNEVEREQIATVQRELKRIDLEIVKRSSFQYCRDKEFHSMIWLLRTKIDEHNDHRWSEKMDKAIRLYIPVLKYFASHQKQLQDTKEWYDFLCISKYMLYGEKFFMLLLFRRVKKQFHGRHRFK